MGPAPPGKAAHLPEHHLLQMLPGEGRHHGEDGVDKEGKHHPHQDHRLVLHLPVQAAGKGQGEKHRGKPAQKPRRRQGECPQNREGETGDHHQRRQQTGPGGDAQGVGGGQGIFQDGLHHRPAGGQGRAGQEGQHRPGKAHPPDNGGEIRVHLRPSPARQAAEENVQHLARGEIHRAGGDADDQDHDGGGQGGRDFTRCLHAALSWAKGSSTPAYASG